MASALTIVDTPDLRMIRDKALEAGLASKRSALVAWFPPDVQGFLPGGTLGIAPFDALTLDLGALNKLDEPGPDGLVYLAEWLRQASALAGPRVALKGFFDRMVDQVSMKVANLAAATGAQGAAGPNWPSSGSAADAAANLAVPERILFRSTLLPDSFISLAALRARAVARLTVPRVECGAQSPGVYGTGWLIGKQHMLTNWHVVRARSTGEPEPARSDIDAQVANATIEFDYIDDNRPSAKVAGGTLVGGDPVLDYALIRMPEVLDREPLPIRGADLVINPEDPLAANVIQHPAGAPRQFAIRNNLAATLQGSDLGYFTDTAGGSSGSPVLNDDWMVIALHKASTPKFGDFSFQGKKTTWVNVGTLITAIIADLRQKDFWAPINATLG